MTDKNTVYNAFASASSYAYTNTNPKQKVTSTANATASSNISYNDALKIANKNAKDIANQNAIHDANVLNQYDSIVNTGLDGLSGPQGTEGPEGTEGTTGPQGTEGTTGPHGTEGIKGTQGPVGTEGTQGPTGSMGPPSPNDLVLLENLSPSNIYDVSDNTYNFYCKTDIGNSASLSPLFFPIENSTINNGTNGQVNAIVSDESGNIYIGGSFTLVGGMSANNIAKWDVGSKSWNNLNNGINGECHALIYSDFFNCVFVGGNFTLAGSIPANNIAKLYPSGSWDTLSSGLNGPCYALANRGNIIVGGSFTSAGSIPVNNIATWGGGWNYIGIEGSGVTIDGSGGQVNSIVVDLGSHVYVGGFFNSAGSISAPIPVNNITSFYWYVPVWNDVGGGVNGPVKSLLLFNDGAKLCAGGQFTIAGQNVPPETYVSANNIALFNINGTITDPQGWSSLSNGGLNDSCNSLAYNPLNQQIYAGGNFTSTFDNSVLFNFIGTCSDTGSDWRTVGGQTNLYGIFSLYFDNFNNLYIGATENAALESVNSYKCGGIARTYTDYVSLSYNSTILTNLFFNGQIAYVYTNSDNMVGTVIPITKQTATLPI